MRNDNLARNISISEIAFIFFTTAIFTSINIIYSSLYGRLSAPPTYDDIGYLNNSLTLLDSGYDLGISTWILNTLIQTWHAPITTLQGCLAFAILGKHLWAPYVLNGVYLYLLIIALRRETPSTPATVFTALIIILLSWPIIGYLIVEFRPDIPTNLLLAIGSWKLARSYNHIWYGKYIGFSDAWSLSWPFLCALWLKPSFSPVTMGIWFSAWGILTAVQAFLSKTPLKSIKISAVSFVLCTIIIALGFTPYLIKSGNHLVDYFVDNVFSKHQDIWSPPLSITNNLVYYLTGEGGSITMSEWAPITALTCSLALVIAIYFKDHKTIMIGGLYGSFGLVSWAGMTYLRNKSPWFGSIVSTHMLGLFIASFSYLASHCQINSKDKGKYIFLATASLGVMLHRWPNSDGVVPATSLEDITIYSRNANHTYHEICDSIVANTLNQKTASVWVPSISFLINPNLVELCRIETNTQIYSLKPSLLNYEEITHAFELISNLPDENLLAFVISEDFPGIPGYLPVSKHIGSINYLFDKSNKYRNTSYINGPSGSGRIRIFMKQPVFSSLENTVGVKAIEGPYPAQNLPLVRWLQFPYAAFDATVTPGQRTKLLLTGRANSPITEASLRISSGEVGRCTFTSNSFQECSLDFLPKNERVHITMDFQEEGTERTASESGQLAVLFSRLEIKGEEPPSEPQPATSAFSYIDFLEGFGSVEGPYPQWKLPVVVWGRGDASRIGVAGTAKQAGTLSLDWRPGVAILGLDIQAQGKTVGHCPSAAQGANFLNCSVDLPLGTLADGLVFRYLAGQPITDKMHNSALFKKIRFIARNGPTND